MMRSEKVIGLIVPSVDVNIEAFYHRFAPKGVAVTTDRISFDGVQIHTLEHMVESYEHAAVDLCHAEPDILISSSLTLGCFLDAAIQRHIEQRSGVPCITSLSAFLEVLQWFHSRRVALLVPYQDDINAMFLQTLRQRGVDVCYTETLKSRTLQAYRSIRELQDLELLHVVRQADLAAVRASGADMLLVGASGIGGAEDIALAEQELGLPILLPDQLALLYALVCIGCYQPAPELGYVFQQPSYDNREMR